MTREAAQMAATVDVALLVDPADEPARHTRAAAMRREGWHTAEGGPAACAVVVWSERGIASNELAALARPFLDERRSLQVLLQPESWSVAEHGRIEAPVPFVYYQGLAVGRESSTAPTTRSTHSG
jgi:hypothetical protein